MIIFVIGLLDVALCVQFRQWCAFDEIFVSRLQLISLVKINFEWLVILNIWFKFVELLWLAFVEVILQIQLLRFWNWCILRLIWHDEVHILINNFLIVTAANSVNLGWLWNISHLGLFETDVILIKLWISHFAFC